MSFPIPAALTPTHALLGGITLVVLLFLDRRRTSRRALPYPPGPRSLPLIGNLLDMPPSKFPLTWSKYGEKYGPLTWLAVPGQNFLVINSFEAAKELLDKRTLIYIDRPRFTMANELLGLSNHLSLIPANGMWKKQRALLKHALSGAMVKRDYSSLLETKAREYVERCAAHPEQIISETTRIVGEVIVKFTYGKLEHTEGRDCIQTISRLLDLIVPSLQGYVVDLFPICELPSSLLLGLSMIKHLLSTNSTVSS
ncbi:hypothetical protein M407DRAFT_18055 [Tulasnella calospora MUT 4182]|uniref:Cytochrome P450 n=1 Tax=Tulasnella calospora MUT 4182 TaxID=1051891 RepID=A0A0C3MHP3_9AGAM|nr:hypothetical protein M407DRAFT_18055 [Tulasnella calospora MUT 4182]